MFPDYSNSIVNLMGSLSRAMNAKPIYEPLAGLDTDYLAEKEIIIMLNIDALGYELVEQLGKNTILGDNVRFEMTSIFPSTTACATVAYQTGMAAWNHGLTGWFVHLKELGASSTILPFCPRYTWDDYEKSGIKIDKILDCGSIYDSFQREVYSITNKSLVNTPVTRYLTGSANSLPYKDLKSFSRNIIKAAKKKSKLPKYIYGYWSKLDHIEHRAGPDGAATAEHFQEICQAIEYIHTKLHKKNYILLISTDHGMLKVTPDKELNKSDFPELEPMLNLPFSGEPRVPYCYIKPEFREKFVEYVQSNMSQYCEIFSRQEMIDKGWYGKGKENPHFRDRIGDYMLLMKENYVLKDKVLGSKGIKFLGYHGGMTPDEMRIPLIIVE
jgi:predicted AlkP superfamily pyrophosphatase or phosphodiesterase